MTLITIASAKGGTGKSTTAVNLASGLANLHETILVDLDDTGHCSFFFGLPVRSGLYDWLVADLPLSDCTLTGRPAGLTILPGDSLTKTVERLHGTPEQFDKVVAALKSLPYELIICDTNASGILMEAALAAADIVIVPFLCETAVLDRVYASKELLAQLNPGADMILLPVRFDFRVREHRLNLATLREQIGDDYLQESNAIPARIAVAECPSYGQTAWEYEGRGIESVRVAYAKLVAHVLAVAVPAIGAQRVPGQAGRQSVEEGEVRNGSTY